jgi:CheY-like chemotaxis protein/HPt (histidine-containing phosphotransfer) domain-containing protein
MALIKLLPAGAPRDAKEANGAPVTARLNKPVRPASLLALLRTLAAADLRDDLSRPIAMPAVVAGPGQAAPSSGGELTDLHLLVVEDNLINQKAAAWTLERLGCCVDVANDGREAVRKADRTAYDLIFMDIQMPEMDGLEATAAIRRLAGPSRRTPIVAMTANVLKGDRERFLAAGMDDYVGKPVLRQDMVSVIKRWTHKTPADNGAPAPPAGAVNQPLQTINLEASLVRYEGDRGVIRRLTQVFQNETPRRLARLAHALAGQDLEAAMQVAHTIKGASSYLDAERLREVAARLEQAAVAGDRHAARMLLQSLRAEYAAWQMALGEIEWLKPA